MTVYRVRRAVVATLAVIATGMFAGVGGTAPAQAGTSYRIDSVAGCQAFLHTFVGPPPAGTVSPGRCVVAGSESGPGEVRLPVGDRLTIGAGWELFFDSVLLFNEGTIVNHGSLRSRDDVVNNVDGGVLVNKGTITIVRGSALNVIGDAVVHNRGRIVLACGGSSGPVLGGQPISIPMCDEPPWVTSTNPAAGARGVPVTARVKVRFSERVTWMRGWYDLRCSVSGGHWSATRRGGGTSLVLQPARRFASGEWCTVRIHAERVRDGGVDLPDTMARDHYFSFRTARRG